MPSSLWQLKAEPVWPETAPGSAARVQPLSAGPTSVDREMTTEAQASGICRHHLVQHMEKQFPATARGKRLWPGGHIRQGWRLPHSLQGPQAPPEAELISWPCPGMWQGCSQLSSCCPPPQPSLHSAGRHRGFVLL